MTRHEAVCEKKQVKKDLHADQGQKRKIDAVYESYYNCSDCNESVLKKNKSSHIRSEKHKSNAEVKYGNNVTKIDSALADRIAIYRIKSC